MLNPNCTLCKMMSDPRPEELIRAEDLMFNGKVEEVIELLNNFENGL